MLSTPNTPPSQQNSLMNGGGVDNGSLLMILPNGPSSFTPSLRKLRHLKCILCRNLTLGIRYDKLILPATYYTLHAPPQNNINNNTSNPVWNPFDCYKPLPDDILENYNSFNICLWDKYNEEEPIFQTDVDLTQLEFIAHENKQFVHYYIPPNSIIFELKDGFYVTKETKHQMSSTQPNDYKFMTSNEKRKSITGNQHLFLSIVSKKLRNMKDTETTKQLSMDIEDKLNSHSEYLEKLRKLEILKHKVASLKEEYYNQKDLLDKDKEKFNLLKKDVVPRAMSLTSAGIVFYSSYQQLLEHKNILEMDKSLLLNMGAALEKKKWHLLSQIRSIYPIQQGNKILTINGLPLPNSDFTGYDEEQIATALGYVCHILFLASKYLDLPLRYPMTPMASRSFIKDEISHHSSSKFPLYSKGVEKRIFDYAVFLLNKNLEQLLNSQGLGMFHLKETLPNVQILLGRSKI
eukprot:gene1978-2435_t